jgi:hypothetical protein
MCNFFRPVLNVRRSASKSIFWWKNLNNSKQRADLLAPYVREFEDSGLSADELSVDVARLLFDLVNSSTCFRVLGDLWPLILQALSVVFIARCAYCWLLMLPAAHVVVFQTAGSLVQGLAAGCLHFKR